MIKLINEFEEFSEQEGAEASSVMDLPIKEVKDPLYQQEFYSRIYNSWDLSRFLDQNWLMNLISLGNSGRLTEACVKEIEHHTKVLQFGATFGDQIEKTAEQVGHYGHYDIVDVNQVQLNRLRGRYETLYPQIRYIHLDAEDPLPERYDTVICYMLLHELPIVSKVNVIKNALNSINEGGKVVFIDYAEPSYWHPLRYIVRMFNRLYQPFAEKLWDRGIDTFVENNIDYVWHKTRYFGGMYQKVVVTRRPKLYEDNYGYNY